jgi:hypothetical protein
MKLPLALVLALAFLMAACGSASSGPDGGLADAGSAPDAFIAPPGSFAVVWGEVSVDPGIERTQCVVKRIGNVTPIKVGTIHNSLSTVSHHLIVYRTSDTEERPTPFDCQPFADTLDPSKGAPIMITQKHDDLLELPAGVAYSMAANQLVRIEMHYINTTDAPQLATATSTFVPMAEADFHDEAGLLFIGTPDIYLGAGQAPSVTKFFPLPARYNDVDFYALTGHTHQFGLDVRINLATSIDDDEGPPLYAFDDWRWSEPPTQHFDPPLVIPAGKGFKFTCAYDNTSDAPVQFGESATDEMCFFWAYYYPDKGAQVCVHTDLIGSTDVCCPGDARCDQLPF